jgi:peptide/histidine transporter 3/4
MDDEQLRATTAMTQVPLLLGEPVSDDGDDESAREAPLQPKIPQSQVLWRVCSFILVTEFCERLSYYGVGGSLVLLFQSRLNYTNAQADNAYAIWSGLCYCAPLLGGWLADSYLGRFKTIGIFSGIYLVGLLVLIIGVLPRDLTDASGGGAAAARRTTEALVYMGIYTLALGDGGIKPNVSTFGADQFDTRLAEGKRAMESFFNSFYAAINCGALISFTLIVSITQYGLPWLGGTDYRFAVGFSIAALFTAGGIGIFLSGRRRYKMMPPTGSVLAISLGILCQAAGKGLRAWRMRRGWVTAAAGQEEDGSTSGSSNSSGSNGGTSSSNSHLPVIASDEEPSASPSSSWLDRAKRSHGGSFAAVDVEGVKCVCRLLPFLFFLIPYWTCYTQVRRAARRVAFLYVCVVFTKR